MNFAVPADHRVKLKECEKRNKYLNLAWELKKLWIMEVTIIPIVIGALDTITKYWYKDCRTWKYLDGWRLSKLLLIEIGENTEKSPGELRKLAVTQTSVENYQSTLMRKTLKEKKKSFKNKNRLQYLVKHCSFNLQFIEIIFCCPTNLIITQNSIY